MGQSGETIFMIGEMTPAKKDPWHSECGFASLVQGHALEITPNGVKQIGIVGGCDRCNTWIWIDLNGDIFEVELRTDREGDEAGKD